MSLFAPHEITELIRSYGAWIVGGIVTLESMGVPAPGECLVVAAGLYAALNRDLNIGAVVIAAAAGAILGDNIGYLIGRRLGCPLLTRYGRRVGLDEGRIRLGRYLFRCHGG